MSGSLLCKKMRRQRELPPSSFSGFPARAGLSQLVSKRTKLGLRGSDTQDCGEHHGGDGIGVLLSKVVMLCGSSDLPCEAFESPEW